MNIRKINWQIWAGFLLSIFAFISYPAIFVEWPVTRDFPWVNLLLFAVALVMVALGVRRAFGRGMISKVGASILALLSVAVLGLFIIAAFVASRWLPESAGAPQVGSKAPDFTLSDTTGKRVSLSELLSTPIEPGASTPKGVLLIFYRGYW